MKRTVQIKPRVWKKLLSLPKHECVECLLALLDLPGQFGSPHAHHGVGIRKLTREVFEFRGNRSLRFLFRVDRELFTISHLCNHDEVRRLLRSRNLD